MSDDKVSIVAPDAEDNSGIPAVDMDAPKVAPPVAEQPAQTAAAAPEPATPGEQDSDATQGGEDTDNAEQQVGVDTRVVQEISDRYQNPIIQKLADIETATDGGIMSVIHSNYDDAVNLLNELDDTSPDVKLLKEIVSMHGQERAMIWLALTSSGIQNLSYKDGLRPTVTYPGAEWLQGILLPNGNVQGIARPPVKNNKPGEDGRLTGNAAMMRARSVMNMGDYVHLPLPHSGLYVTILIAGDDEFVDMQTALMNEKVTIGRRTNGVVFNNLDVIVKKHMTDFLLGMITDTSIGTTDKKVLRGLIKEQDLDVLAGAYLGGRYKAGYQLAQACEVDPKQCTHVEVGKVNLSRLMITDNSRLTNFQRDHMARYSARTVDQVIAYQTAFEVLKDNTFEIDGVKYYLRVPSLEQKIESGQDWINAIEQAIATTFNNSMTREQREEYINKQAALSAMRGYAHWVARIEFEDGGFVDDEETLATLLKQFTSKDDIKEAFMNQVNAFINRTTISIMAMPRWTCPNCGKRQPLVKDTFPAFTPLNVGKIFFTLMTNTLNLTFEKADI
jgi:hypothetical protein